MRKLKLQVQITVDGYMAGLNNQMDWVAFNWDNGLKKYVAELTDPVDCIILGRNLALGFIPHWASHPEQEGADKFNSTQKVVFTKTLEKSEWDRTIIAQGNLVDEINKLKNMPGKDIIAYGGATFVADLVKYGLIDEYHLFINPTAIGKGKSIFSQLEGNLQLSLVKSSTFECGIVVLHYQPKREG